jgi:hypothetical protein
MLWLEPFPWLRWTLVSLVAVVAVYVEFRPDPTVPVPFATTMIAPGEIIDTSNTEIRNAPAGLLEPGRRGDVATTPILPGAPVLASEVGEQGRTVPPGWWIVTVPIPDGAVAGDEVRLVLLDSALDVPGVVASPGSDDAFATADGTVAVPPEGSTDVAMAAANGRLVVLLSSGRAG